MFKGVILLHVAIWQMPNTYHCTANVLITESLLKIPTSKGYKYHFRKITVTIKTTLFGENDDKSLCKAECLKPFHIGYVSLFPKSWVQLRVHSLPSIVV